MIIEKIPETRFELVQRGPDGNHFHIADLKLFVNGISVADCEDYSAKVAKLFRLQSSPEGYRRLNKISVIEPSEHPWTIFNDKANFTSGLLSIKNVQLTFFKDFGSTKVSVTEACLFLSNSLSLQWEVTTKEAWRRDSPQEKTLTLQCNPVELAVNPDFSCAISIIIDYRTFVLLFLYLRARSTKYEMSAMDFDSCIQNTSRKV